MLLKPVNLGRFCGHLGVKRRKTRNTSTSHICVTQFTNAPLLCDFIAVQHPASNPHSPVKFSQMTPNGQIAGSRILPWGPPHGFSQQAVKSTDSHSFTDVPIFAKSKKQKKKRKKKSRRHTPRNHDKSHHRTKLRFILCPNLRYSHQQQSQ